MKYITSIILNAVCALSTTLPAQAANPIAGASALQDAFAEVAAKAKSAVVNLSVMQEQQVMTPYFFFGDPEDFFNQFEGGGMRPKTHRSYGTGSGFIVDPKGYVLTNDHVIRGATEIKVTLTQPNGKDKTYMGKVVDRDPNMDLAVVKIKSDETFQHLTLAKSAPRVGDWAIAIGSPFGLEQTVTVGIISAVRQSLPVEGRRYMNMIQTDAAINQGNSGGPLLNLQGEVVGVNTAIYSPSGASAGIGFAIPAEAVAMDLKYLLSGKQLKRGWIGVETAPIDEVIRRRFALPSTEGALINSVVAGSPAQKAGLKRGDAIVRIDGKPVASPQALATMTGFTEAGKKVTLQVYRKSVPMDIAVTLGQRPEWMDGEHRPPQRARPGASQEQAPQERETVLHWNGVEFVQQEEGVIVASLGMDSPLAGYLKKGDLVRGLNQSEIATLDDLRTATRGVKLSDGVFLDILRQGQPLYLSVQP